MVASPGNEDATGLCLDRTSLAIATDALVAVATVELPPQAVSAPEALVEALGSHLSFAPRAVCLSLDAALSGDRRTVLAYPPWSAWRETPLAERLSARLKLPIALATHAEAGALAYAAARELRGTLLYMLATRTVSAGVVHDGRLAVLTTPARDAVEMIGHLGTTSSAQAIVRAYIGRASASDADIATMLWAAGGRAEALSAARVMQLAADGDHTAESVIAPALGGLASAIAHLMPLFMPDRIVIAGPLARAAGYVRARLGALLGEERHPFIDFTPFDAMMGARGAMRLACHTAGLV